MRGRANKKELLATMVASYHGIAREPTVRAGLIRTASVDARPPQGFERLGDLVRLVGGPAAVRRARAPVARAAGARSPRTHTGVQIRTPVSTILTPVIIFDLFSIFDISRLRGFSIT